MIKFIIEIQSFIIIKLKMGLDCFKSIESCEQPASPVDTTPSQKFEPRLTPKQIHLSMLRPNKIHHCPTCTYKSTSVDDSDSIDMVCPFNIHKLKT